MKKLSLELPKYRLQVHLKLVRRRKPLVEEPILPSLGTVKKKYKSGSLIGRYFRHVFEHKNIRKVFGGGLALFIVGSSFIPQTSVIAQEPEEEVIVQAQTSLITEKSLQNPLSYMKVNQNYSYFHPGLDLGGPVGLPIKSVKPGKVVFAGYSTDGYGNNVVINHGDGLISLYAHMSKIDVKDGQEIAMNTQIGLVGKTGRATGPHLHLEIRLEGRNINPQTFLNR